LGTVKLRREQALITWKRLRELMDVKYYPRDAKRANKRQFLSLKQGNMSLMEYTAKFNELSWFSPHQVAAKEMKMDHFKQGMKGSVKSMIAGHSFENFKEMYQRAVKLARVLEETNWENRASNLGKRKIDYNNRELRGVNPKRFNTEGPQNKGKQPMSWQNRTPYRTYDKLHFS